jgi:hypothetical protein
MQTIAAQLAALAVTDTLKKASKPASLTKIPWAALEGTWAEATGWSPSGFLASPPSGTRSGFYFNTEEKSGNHAVGLKKTTGSLEAVDRQFEVWMCSAMGANPSGYQFLVLCEATGKVKFILRRFIEGEAKVLWESAPAQTFNENDSIFLVRANGLLLCYYRAVEGTPVLLGGAMDATFTKGFCAFGGNGSNPKLINFVIGALTVTAEVKRFRNMNGNAKSTMTASIGACDRTEDISLVALVRVPTKPVTASRAIKLKSKTQGEIGYSLEILSTGKLRCEWYESSEPEVRTASATPAEIFTFDDHWKLIVVRKEVGAKKADFGIYDFVTRAWTWEEGSSGAAAKSLPAGAEGSILVGDFLGDVAALMLGAVMSRATAETLPNVTSLIDWRTLAKGLWFIHGESISVKFEDETAGGANQTNTPTQGAIVAEAPPIPYYNPTMGFTRTLIASVVGFVKRWTYSAGAIRRF